MLNLSKSLPDFEICHSLTLMLTGVSVFPISRLSPAEFCQREVIDTCLRRDGLAMTHFPKLWTNRTPDTFLFSMELRQASRDHPIRHTARPRSCGPKHRPCKSVCWGRAPQGAGTEQHHGASGAAARCLETLHPLFQETSEIFRSNADLHAEEHVCFPVF